MKLLGPTVLAVQTCTNRLTDGFVGNIYGCCGAFNDFLALWIGHRFVTEIVRI